MCSIKDVKIMRNIGLYLNDLSMHDSSRDLALIENRGTAEIKSILERVSFFLCLSPACLVIAPNLHSECRFILFIQEQAINENIKAVDKKLGLAIKKRDKLFYSDLPQLIIWIYRSEIYQKAFCQVLFSGDSIFLN